MQIKIFVYENPIFTLVIMHVQFNGGYSKVRFCYFFSVCYFPFYSLSICFFISTEIYRCLLYNDNNNNNNNYYYYYIDNNDDNNNNNNKLIHVIIINNINNNNKYDNNNNNNNNNN